MEGETYDSLPDLHLGGSEKRLQLLLARNGPAPPDPRGRGHSAYSYAPLRGGTLPLEVTMINEFTELDILEAERYGRDVVQVPGGLASRRSRFHLSVRRCATILGTAGQVVARWEADPEMADRMHSMTAVRLGQLAHHLDQIEQSLYDDHGLRPEDLLPIAVITSELGLSPSSATIARKCRSGALTCIQLGRLGTYIPASQADQLRRKEI